MRDKLGKAIIRAFERTYTNHGINYDPDTCYEAADEVIAVLLSELIGEQYNAVFNKNLIGPAEFRVVEEEA